MFRMIAGFFCTVLLALALCAPALAVGDDVFVVPRVKIQAMAQSATAAKATAQTHGRRRAMDILLRRLTVEDDWDYLPELAAGQPAKAPGGIDRNPVFLSDQDLELLESGFEVFDEKSSSTTYRASVTYRFKPAAIRKLLKDAQIPYSEAQMRTALVLPVLETENGAYLWEENNPWMAAWKARPYNNELTPMVAPLGDLEDITTISARQALALAEEALKEMASRYSVRQVIIAHAQLRQIDGEDRLRVRFINGFRESVDLALMDELGGAENGASDYSAGVNQGPQGDNPFLAARTGDLLAEESFAQPSGDFPMLAELSIEVTLAKYAKPWKKQTLIDHTVASLLEVSAYYRSLDEWTRIRAALVSTPLVGSVQVHALSRSGSDMLVRAYGDPSKLVVAMDAEGLALWTEDNERWLIATPETARDLRSAMRGRRSRLEGFDDAAQGLPGAVIDGQGATAPTSAEY